MAEHPTIGMLKKISAEIFNRTLRGETNFEQDTRTIRSYIDIATQLNEPMLVAQLWGRLGMVYSYNGKVEQAIEYILTAYNLYREQGAHSGMATILNNLSFTCYMVGRYEDTLRYCEQGYEHIKDEPDNLTRAFLSSNLASACWVLGMSDKAEAMAHRCLDIIGDRTKESTTSYAAAKNILAELYLTRGDFAAAWNAINLAHEFSLGTGDHIIIGRIIFTKAHLAAEDHDHPTLPEDYYEAGRKILSYDKTRIMQARMFMHEANYQMRQNHIPTAKQWLKAAADIFREVNAEEETRTAEMLLKQ